LPYYGDISLVTSVPTMAGYGNLTTTMGCSRKTQKCWKKSTFMLFFV